MKRLSALLPYLSLNSAPEHDPEVSGIEYDSRTVTKNSLYVARRGQDFDGHDYINDAITRGASVIVCERLPVEPADDNRVTFVQVSDSLIALAQLSHAFYDFPSRNLQVIGVTGTNGKTTCSYLLKQIFEAIHQPVGMIGTTGNFIGDERIESKFTTPESPELCSLFARMVDRGVRTVVMEVSSHAIALERIHGVRFAAGLFTNLTQDHLDFHSSMADYAAVKKKFFDSLDTHAVAIINSDDPYAEYMFSDCKAKVSLVGRTISTPGPGSTRRLYSISDEQLTTHNCSFTLNNQEFQTPLIGSFNIDNAALCVATSLELGVAADIVSRVIAKVHGAPGRMQSVQLTSGVTSVVDYAHSPDALEKALTTCRQLMSDANKLICVFGCGGDRDSTKRPLMGAIASRLADLVIITNDNPRTESPEAIAQDIIKGILSPGSVSIILDRAQAIDVAVSQAAKGDVVLIAGKGHEENQIIGKERLHFSDVEELKKFVENA